jgi:hypothetical protein
MDGQGGLAAPETSTLIGAGAGVAVLLGFLVVCMCLRSRWRAQRMQALEDARRAAGVVSDTDVDLEAAHPIAGRSPRASRLTTPRQKGVAGAAAADRGGPAAEPAQQQQQDHQKASTDSDGPSPASSASAEGGDGAASRSNAGKGAKENPRQKRRHRRSPPPADDRGAGGRGGEAGGLTLTPRRRAAPKADGEIRVEPSPRQRERGTDQPQLQPVPPPTTPSKQAAPVEASRPPAGRKPLGRTPTSSFLRGETVTRPIGEEEMPEALRERIREMRRELRLEREVTAASPRTDRLAPLQRGARGATPTAAARQGASADGPPPRTDEGRSPRGGRSPPVAVALSPRKQRIEPPTVDEEGEMALFRHVDHSMKQQREEARFSPAVKLRELRREFGMESEPSHRDARGAAAERPKTEAPPRESRGRRRSSCSRRPSEEPQQQQRRQQSRAAPQHGSSCSVSPVRTGSYQKRKPTAAGAPGGVKRQGTTGVEGLKERTRKEEALQKERASKKAGADRLLRQWTERTNGDVYAMMSSVKQFADLFSTDPLAGATLTRGDAPALKKAWHKLAAKLHPDRQRANSTAIKVLAEEVFKALTIAYQKENQRLGARA